MKEFFCIAYILVFILYGFNAISVRLTAEQPVPYLSDSAIHSILMQKPNLQSYSRLPKIRYSFHSLR
jgi:hypothetical protein